VSDCVCDIVRTSVSVRLSAFVCVSVCDSLCVCVYGGVCLCEWV